MSKHFIKTVRLDLTANSEKEGFQIQQEFSELMRTKLNQKMKDIFDQFGEDENIRIENLELEVQGIQAENWEENFMEKFSQQLIAKLKGWKSNSTSSPSSTTPTPLSKWRSFLFFLENGYFPWHNNQLTINTLDSFLLKEIESNQAFVLLAQQVKDDSIALQRLINHLPITTLDFIFHKLARSEYSFLPFYKILEKTFVKKWNKNQVKLEIWKMAFQSLFENSPERIGVKNFRDILEVEIIKKSLTHFSRKKIKIKSGKKLDQLFFEELKTNFSEANLNLSSPANSLFKKNEWQNERSPEEDISKQTKNQSTNSDHKTNSMEKKIKEGIFISNAGLVLLNPYLQMFFNRIELTEGKVFKNEIGQNQAALVLQYLVTGELSFMEHELVFNKILCNIPLDAPIPTELSLDKNQIKSCDDLLNAVIQNWGKLGDISIQALRETFILRNGKLSKKEDGDWLLQVESKSFDILLDSLPWQISIIKLPWMNEKILVNWH
ncbi:MAG: contractile injection system tape measure protein [Saprospiraceae bacterium]